MVIKKKVVLLGNSAVGKTSLIKRFVYDKFEDSYIATIGSKVTKKNMSMMTGGQEKGLTLMIWDVLGSEGYKATHARTLAGAHGAILVSDLTRKDTLDSLERYWIPLLVEVVDKIPLVFVCNKSDLVGDASSELEAARELSSRHNVGLEGALPAGFSACLATSAKTGSNVEAVFETLGHLLLSEKKPEDPLKELCESLFSESIQRKTDRRTLVGVTDVLIVDFCKGFDSEAVAMNALRKQFIRAGLDVRNPSRDALFRAVEYMAEAESGSHDEPAVMANRERRMRLVESAGSRTAALERPDGTAKVSR